MPVLETAAITATGASVVGFGRAIIEARREIDPENIDRMAMRGEQRRRVARRRVNRAVGRWLAENEFPRARNHALVIRLVVQMGDHPFGRDYWVIAKKFVFRWLNEGLELRQAAESELVRRIGSRPVAPVSPKKEEDSPKRGNRKRKGKASGGSTLAEEAAADLRRRQEDWDYQLHGLIGDMTDEYAADPFGFSENWATLLPAVKPPPVVLNRFINQIIEAAIAVRVDDLDEAQNIFASNVVREAGNFKGTWWVRFVTWSQGLTGCLPRDPYEVPDNTR